MKKQIFILVMAIFATTAAFAQPYALPGTKPTPLTCALTDPLTPVAGRPYDYSAVIAPPGGTAFWYATNSTTFTTAGARVATVIPADDVKIAASSVGYNTAITPASSPTKTTITWTSAGLAGIDATTKPLFVVVEYTGPSATCANNNIKVIQILPKVAFTVDITNMTNAATPVPLAIGAPTSQCFDMVQSVKFTAGKIDIDYGTNILYFEVIAANFTGSYKPTLKLTGLQGTQTAAIDWGIAIGTYGQTLVADQAPTAGAITSPQFTVQTQATSTADGVSIFVRVTVKNHGFEGLADLPVTLAVEAIDSATPGNPDVMANCTVSPTPFEDTSVQTLKLRPTVTTTPASLVQNP
jgi:hypothetical protein